MILYYRFLKFDPDYLTYPTILRSYLNIYAIFDCGNARSSFKLGPTLDCGKSSEDFVVLIFDAKGARVLNFPRRLESIGYLEDIYPKQDEVNQVLDGGNSASITTIYPGIDCGNAGYYDVPCNNIFEWSIKENDHC